jgi:4-hydroxy-L-threonine phosphate dehydrogenase PdxA
VKGYFCEFNTLGTLWTSRISSHIPLADIPKYVTKDRIKAGGAN